MMAPVIPCGAVPREAIDFAHVTGVAPVRPDVALSAPDSAAGGDGSPGKAGEISPRAGEAA